MGKPVEQNENTGLSGNAGNASNNLVKGKLKTAIWKLLVGILIAVALVAVAIVILG